MTKLELTDAALDLRRRGFTFREISGELRVPLRRAHRLVKDALTEQAAKAAANAELLIQLQDARLEKMYKGLAGSAEGGNARSVEVALKLLERQAKLHGLDAPTKQEVKVAYAELSDQELLAEAERLKLRVELTQSPPQVPLLPLPGEVFDAEVLPPSPAHVDPAEPLPEG